MMLDDEGRKILGTGDLKAALAHARRHKMIYLQEAALSKVVSGETVYRGGHSHHRTSLKR